MSDTQPSPDQPDLSPAEHAAVAAYRRTVAGLDPYKNLGPQDMLARACERDDVTAMRKAIERGASIEQLDIEKTIKGAVQSGSAKILAELESLGVNVLQDAHLWIKTASKQGQLDVIKFFHARVPYALEEISGEIENLDIQRYLAQNATLCLGVQFFFAFKAIESGDLDTLKALQRQGLELAPEFLEKACIHNQKNVALYLKGHFKNYSRYSVIVAALTGACYGNIALADLLTAEYKEEEVSRITQETVVRSPRLLMQALSRGIDAVDLVDTDFKIPQTMTHLMNNAIEGGCLKSLAVLSARNGYVGAHHLHTASEHNQVSAFILLAETQRDNDITHAWLKSAMEKQFSQIPLEILTYVSKKGFDLAVYYELLDLPRFRLPRGSSSEWLRTVYGLGVRLKDPHIDVFLHDTREDAQKIYELIKEYQPESAMLKKHERDRLAPLLAKQARWQKQVRMDPPKGLEDENPALFKKAAFDAAVAMLKEEGHADKEIVNFMAFYVSSLLQTPERLVQYLRQHGVVGKQPLHDLVQMISLPEGDITYSIKDWGDAVLKCGPGMANLVKFANKMPSPLKTDDGRTWSFIKTRAACAQFAFNRAAENPQLAQMCMEYSVNEADFETTLETIAMVQTQTKNIPDIILSGEEFDMPGATFRRLAPDDLRGLFLGEMTACCQSIGKAGAQCAEHGFMSPHGGFYVVENAKGKIIGQAWAWRGEKGEMCLDSLEFLPGQVTPTQWQKILERMRDELATRTDHDVTALHVGRGGQTPDAHLAATFRKSAVAEPLDYLGYRDSDDKPQILVWNRVKQRA